jgi:YHS domain-containing protein
MKTSTLIVFICLLVSGTCSFGQDNATRTKHYNINSSKLALKGYDPVSYFGGTPKTGRKEYVVYHEGILYRFHSKKNKDLFKTDPEKYSPTYGGWCAYAMGNTGEKVEVNIETYKIVDGKLYLFYNKLFNNTLEDWNEDESRLKDNADKNWSSILLK